MDLEKRCLNMLEKRLWSNLPIILIGMLACITVWQMISSDLPHEMSDYSNTIYRLYSYNSTRPSFPMHKLISHDYSQLIDLNFTFNTLSLVCNESNSPLLLVLVHSSPKNIAKRKTIRETWGHYKDNIKVLFMLGVAINKELQIALEKENQLYNDFVQGNFLDTYRNITYKHVMAFKYVIYHCSQAKYILKTDDDVFVNMPAMENFLKIDLSPYGARRMLLCAVKRNSKVLRTYRSKWRVSFSEYPQKVYPSYCPGWTLLYSPDVVFDLYREAQDSEYFWIDDIHITGTLAEKAHIEHTNIEPLIISLQDMNTVKHGSENISKPFLFGRANLDESSIRILWDFVTSHPTPKSILKSLQL